ncbi:hypothetical protein IJ670_05970 [bacterium]|nr:hypothetical protein [bacterium]
MKKLLSLFVITIFAMAFQYASAQDAQINTINSEQATKSFDDAVKDYHFDEANVPVATENKSESEVTLQEETTAKKAEKSDADVPTFWNRVIDSGYFSSKTSTKTYMPLNK